MSLRHAFTLGSFGWQREFSGAVLMPKTWCRRHSCALSDPCKDQEQQSWEPRPGRQRGESGVGLLGSTGADGGWPGGGFRATRRRGSAAVEAAWSLEVELHGEGQLRRGGGAGQEAAGMAETQSDEPFFGGLVG